MADLYTLSNTYEMIELQNFTSKNSEPKSRSNSSSSTSSTDLYIDVLFLAYILDC